MNSEPDINGLSLLLAADGLIDPSAAVFTPLGGGVSCDVVKVECGKETFVVKRALEKLRVEDDWRADVGRNRYEHLYMEYVGSLLPGAVPRVFHANDTRGFFCMEWLGEGWRNWKDLLLTGDCRIAHAHEAGRILGSIHRQTFGDKKLLEVFDGTKNFTELRLDPYLLTTGQKHPALRELFEAEAARIASTRTCLVHGDYSPKNILVRKDRMLILDCEVAWFGDPSFDLAFFLNHLHLKALHHAPEDRGLRELVGAATHAYFSERNLAPDAEAELKRATTRLLAMLMLARVDGKSPAEYLSACPEKQDFIRQFATAHLSAGRPPTLVEFSASWFDQLSRRWAANHTLFIHEN